MRPFPARSESADEPKPRRRGTLAFLGYVAISFCFFGLHVLPHLNSVLLGNARDPRDPFALSWFLRWWPFALIHGMDPLVTHHVWSPVGYRLAGTTAIPGPSLVLWPITTTAGPVAAYNVAMLLAPALSAWTAFLLFRTLTGRTWPSFIGGYVFGFSTFALGQLSAHLNLSLTFLVPLMAWLVALAWRRRIRPGAFVALEALCVAAQFLIAPEVLATVAVMGVVVFVVGLLFSSGRRDPVLRVAGLTLGAIVVGSLLASPYLVPLLGQTRSLRLLNPLYSTDLVNLAVPTPITALHAGWTTDIAAGFRGNYSETGSYIGIPLLLTAVLFMVRYRRRRFAWASAVVLVSAVGAALGPRLLVQGHATVPLPWAMARRLPLLRYALPERFMLYAFLVLGFVVAVLLADGAASRRGRIATGVLVALVVVTLAPNVRQPYWHAPAPPSPIETGAVLASGRTVLFVPFGRAGAQAMLWQADAGMSFRMAGGYVSCGIPPEYERWQAVVALLRDDPAKTNRPEMRTFLVAHHVELVVLSGAAGARWSPLFSSLGYRARTLPAATVFTVPPGIPLGAAPPMSAARQLNDCNA